EALMRSLSAKCRRDARKGLRGGVTVVCSDSEDILDALLAAVQSMSARKAWQWAIRPVQFAALRPLWRKGWIKSFTAMRQGRICNMALLDVLGVPQYALGAIASAGRSSGCPPTGQLLHYEIMKWLRDRGQTY